MSIIPKPAPHSAKQRQAAYRARQHRIYMHRLGEINDWSVRISLEGDQAYLAGSASLLRTIDANETLDSQHKQCLLYALRTRDWELRHSFVYHWAQIHKPMQPNTPRKSKSGKCLL